MYPCWPRTAQLCNLHYGGSPVLWCELLPPMPLLCGVQPRRSALCGTVEYSVVLCGTYSRGPSGIPQVYEAHDGVCDEWTADIEFRDFEHARFKPKPLDDEVRSDCVPTDVGRPIVVEGRLCDTAVQYSRVPCP